MRRRDRSDATGKTPVGTVGRPLPVSISPPLDSCPVICPCWSSEPLTAIFAVASQVLVAASIHGPSRNAPPPLNWVMHEYTEPLTALVAYF